ncbi:unnamed protein product [Clonostachys solani]|uniref:Uncharacterized protein n=1 Tax=Clonostachys solani TaxID=160281 RepID=A0A9N9Z6E0_9HYPO|nr:unnamed protein product [Clonostachys solani]
MRHLQPRTIGSVCQFCSPTLPRAARESLLVRSLNTNATASRSPTTRRLAPSSLIRTRPFATVSSQPESPQSSNITTPTKALRKSSTPTELANSIDGSHEQFLAGVEDIHGNQLASHALGSCLQAASALHPQLRRAQSQAQASASRLALLGAERTGAKFAIDADLMAASDKISQTAYQLVSHKNVEMTSDILELYVNVQAQLGRPETLPAVFELYASKPKPQVRNGQLQYIPQNPNGAAKAIEKPVADLALATAIDARNLDAALGITETAFCVTAFRRQKLLKHATAPAIGLATLPFGIYGLATAYATYWQNTMDVTTATGVGIAGISGYFFVTGGLGMIAKLSAKEQMRRVTWLPGTPLRFRWMREEEREALDKIACAWGFKESWRHGEESGPDWEGLREYMGYRQMILDRVEFMEGMN